MLANEESCESLDESYSAEDEENGTDPTCNQQRGRKQRKRMKNKTAAELQGVKLTTDNNKTNGTLCITCQKNKKMVAPIGITAGRNTILNSAEKKMIWLLPELDPQIQVIHSFIIHATFAMSHTFSPKRNHKMKMKT